MPGLMILRATLRRTGCCLLGHIDDADAPFADLLQQLVWADDRAGLLDDGGSRIVAATPMAGDSRKLPSLFMLQEPLDFVAKPPVLATLCCDKRLSLCGEAMSTADRKIDLAWSWS